MDFYTLPDFAFLKIFNYLPLVDQVRTGRVNSAFRRISVFIVSHTKELDLAEDHFCNINQFCLSKLLLLCSGNVERVVIPEHMERSLSTPLANEVCPQLRHVSIYNSGNETMKKLLRNSPNIQTLYWGPTGNFLEYPQYLGNSQTLSSLECSCNDASFRSLIRRVPNLKHLTTFAVVNHGGLIDQFFATTPKLESLNVQFSRNNVDFLNMPHFWQLNSLTSLRISYEAVVACPYLPNDAVLKMIALSFGKLRTLELLCVGVSMSGVEALGNLRELRELVLYGINAQDMDAAVERLAQCKGLNKLRLSGALVTSSTLLTLLYSCPDLSLVSLREIIGVDNPRTAVRILNSCSGLRRRYVTVELSSPDQFAYAIWKSNPAQNALKELKEHGPVIKFSRGS